MPGTRKRSWRVSERRMLCRAYQCSGRRPSTRICMPTTGQKRETILSPCADAAMREASLAKSDTSCTGEEVARRKTQGGDHGGHHEGVFHHGNQAVELARAVVVARNGEHALVESHDDEADEHGQTVANTISPHGGVAAIALHGVHEQATDERGARVDENWGSPMTMASRMMRRSGRKMSRRKRIISPGRVKR